MTCWRRQATGHRDAERTCRGGRHVRIPLDKGSAFYYYDKVMFGQQPAVPNAASELLVSPRPPRDGPGPPLGRVTGRSPDSRRALGRTLASTSVDDPRTSKRLGAPGRGRRQAAVARGRRGGGFEPRRGRRRRVLAPSPPPPPAGSR